MRKNVIQRVIPVFVSLALCPATGLTGQHSGEATAGRTPSVTPSGGTVNVYLANANGLVAVTDSLLSNGRGPVGYDVKLFKIDDHTLCSVAGWYSNPGPETASGTYPAFQEMPRIIQTLIDWGALSRGATLQIKIDTLSNYVAYSIGIIEKISKMSGARRNPEGSMITMASLDGHSIQIARTWIAPTQQGESDSYSFFDLPTITVGDELKFWVAGQDSIGNDVLGTPKPDQGDPALDKYYRAFINDHGKGLSLDDLRQIAVSVEIMTAANVPRLVGGPIQVGSINKDGVAQIDQPGPQAPVDPTKSTPFFGDSNQVHLEALGDWRSHPRTARIHPLNSGKTAAFWHDSSFRNIGIQLDGALILKSSFDNCLLVYNGSENFLFDTSNIVTNSVLMLGRGVDASSRAVQQIRRDFPDLLVEGPEN